MLLGILSTVVLVMVALGVSTVAAGWFVADRVVRPRRLPPTPILASSPRSITLGSTPLSRFPGPMGFLNSDESRHYALGDVLLESPEGVSRAIGDPADSLRGDSKGRVVADPFGTPAGADLNATELTLRGEVAAPAWIIQSSRSEASGNWAIHIHGAMSERASMIRTARSFAAQGFTSLVVTYRGDEAVTGAGRSGSTLGQTEWIDIQPAVEFALSNGAKRVVLVGMSVGATIALRFVDQSELRSSIFGLVLIAPIVNWKNSIASMVRSARLPSAVSAAATIFLQSQLSTRLFDIAEPVRFAELDFAERGTNGIPTLIFHQRGDPVASHEDSVRLTERFGTDIQLISTEGTQHALEWNQDPTGFDTALGEWLSHHLPLQ